MGITGLLPYLSHTLTKKNLIKYRDTKVGIDGHSWLYQIAPFFATDLFYNIQTTKYCDRLKHKLNLLKQHNITPIFIFDGDLLPSKKHTNDLRKERKQKIRDEIMALLKRNEIARANALMKQCVSISKEMLQNVIQMLRNENVEYIVSPYESDAQMCYLQKIGYIDYIMTEDSDLIAFGSDKILYKFDGTNVYEFDRSKMKNATDNVFSENVLEICVLSGCDYLPSIKGIGLATAHKIYKETMCYKSAIQKIGIKKTIPENYVNEFERALITFKEHIVFDPILKTRLHLSGKTSLDDETHYEFLGPLVIDNALELSQGMQSIEVSQSKPKENRRLVTITKAIEKGNKKQKEVIVDENEYSPFFNKYL